MRNGILCGIAVLLSGCVGEGQRGTRLERRDAPGCSPGRVPPELVSSPRHWMNAGGGPENLDGLRGRVVWLQFNF